LTGFVCAGLPLAFVFLSLPSIGILLLLPVLLLIAVVARGAYFRTLPTEARAKI
jgi:hypothetical protein